MVANTIITSNVELDKMSGTRRTGVFISVFFGIFILHMALEGLARLNDAEFTLSLWYPPAGLIFATIIYFRSAGAAIMFATSVCGFFIFREADFPILDGLAYITLLILNMLFWRSMFVRLGILGQQLMQKPRWAIGLMGLALIVSITSALLGVIALWIAGIVRAPDLPEAYLRFFLGDYIGLLSVGPLMALVVYPAILRARHPKRDRTWRWMRTIIIYGMLGLLGILLITNSGPEHKLRLVYLGSVPVIVAAVSGRIRETCVAIFMFMLATTTALAIANLQIEIDLSLFIILILVVSYIVAASISSQRATAKSLTATLAERDELSASRRQLAEQVNHLQKMESLGTLAGGMAHELNNLLQPILTFSRAAETAENPQRLEYLARVRECGLAARILVKDVLQFARPQEKAALTPPEPQALAEMLPNVLAIAREVLPAHILVTVPPKIPNIRIAVEPEKLTQIFMNVFRNASDAMPGGGTLEITASVPDDLPAIITTHQIQARRYLCLAIKDSGLGMDPDTLARAADPFFTTKAIGRGTGLGLSTVHGIIHAWRGNMELASTPGAGATIKLWIPVHSVA
jgi:signal transduction histidine kinase